MRKHVWAIVVLTAITACSGPSTTPTSPSNGQSTGAGGTGSSPPSNNNNQQIEGAISALPPTTAALTFTVAGKTVVTTSSTVFVSDGATKTFADLKVGMKVEVTGTLSGSTLTATRVELEIEEEPVPPPPTTPPPTTPPPTPPPPKPPAPVQVEVRGTISGLTGTASSFQFMLGTTLVKGDASTMITGGGDNNDDAIKDDAPKTFADLRNGLTVEVNGTQQTGFVQAVRIQIEEEPKAPGTQAEVEGTLGTVAGTCPAITTTVGTTKVTTTASTKFEDVTCAALKAGMKVQVEGTRNADGSITATKVERND